MNRFTSKKKMATVRYGEGGELLLDVCKSSDFSWSPSADRLMIVFMNNKALSSKTQATRFLEQQIKTNPHLMTTWASDAGEFFRVLILILTQLFCPCRTRSSPSPPSQRDAYSNQQETRPWRPISPSVKTRGVDHRTNSKIN